MKTGYRIDFHAHILPGADHGCRNLTMAMEQLQLAKEAEVDVVVATPHFYPHKETLEAFLTRRERTYSQLCEEIKGKDLPKVILGAEVYLCPGLQDLEGLETLCMGQSNTILFKMPREKSKPELFVTLDEVREFRHLNPVMAHIDRYESSDVEKLLAMELPAQLNAVSLCSFWRRRKLLSYVHAGQIFALGTDIHGTEIGYSEFKKAEAVLKEEFWNIMEKTRKLLQLPSC